MILKNDKSTSSDRRYHDEKGKITEAAKQGRLGKSWFFKNPKTGKQELRPHRLIKRV